MFRNIVWFICCVISLVFLVALFECTSVANWETIKQRYPGYTAIATMGSTTYYVNDDNDVIVHTYNWQGLDEMVVVE